MKNEHCHMKQTLQWVLGRVKASAMNSSSYGYQMALDIHNKVIPVVDGASCRCCCCCCKEEA